MKKLFSFVFIYFTFAGVIFADCIHIRDDVTGGDCSAATITLGSPIGIWDNRNKSVPTHSF